MVHETDLRRVKLLAHTLLDVRIQQTSFSPMIVSHPFTNSGITALRNEDGSLSMVDLVNNADDYTKWRSTVGKQIDSAENAHEVFALLNPPYYLTFIKFTAAALSEQDLGKLLSIAWTQEECPNQDCNISKRELLALFRSVSPEYLMDEEERQVYESMEDSVTVYRGVTPYNQKNVCTTENDDWLNIYANYDLERGCVCDTLEVFLQCSNGDELDFKYRLSPEEQALFIPKMNTYCQEHWGQSLEECCADYLTEQSPASPEMQM